MRISASQIEVKTLGQTQTLRNRIHSCQPSDNSWWLAIQALIEPVTHWLGSVSDQSTYRITATHARCRVVTHPALQEHMPSRKPNEHARTKAEMLLFVGTRRGVLTRSYSLLCVMAVLRHGY